MLPLVLGQVPGVLVTAKSRTCVRRRRGEASLETTSGLIARPSVSSQPLVRDRFVEGSTVRASRASAKVVGGRWLLLVPGTRCLRWGSPELDARSIPLPRLISPYPWVHGDAAPLPSYLPNPRHGSCPKVDEACPLADVVLPVRPNLRNPGFGRHGGSAETGEVRPDLVGISRPVHAADSRRATSMRWERRLAFTARRRERCRR